MANGDQTGRRFRGLFSRGDKGPGEAGATPTSAARRTPSFDPFELAAVGLLILDQDGVVLRANRVALTTIGFARTDIEGVANVVDLAEMSYRTALGQHLVRAISRDRAGQIPVQLLHKDGSSRAVVLHTVPRGGDGDSVVHVHCAIVGGTERRAPGQGSASAPQKDDVTPAMHRDYFLNVGEIALRRTREANEPFSVVMIDLDHFGPFVFRHGSDAANAALTSFVSVAQEQLRGRDLLSRLEGDGFAVCLPGADSATATRVAERIRSALERTPLAIGGGRSVRCTASFGVVSARALDGDLEDVVLRAQVQQQVAKEEGRNRVSTED